MTLGTTPPLADYLEDGVTLAHAVPFQFRSASDIHCSRILAGVETLLTQGSDFTVAGGAGSTGTVTKTSAGVAGTIFRIKRVTTRAQTTDYTPGDAFPAETHEAALDHAAAVDQEQDISLADLEARSLRLSEGELTAAFTPAARRGKVMSFGTDPAAAPALLDRTDFKGDPGGYPGDIGTFAQASLINIPVGMDIIATAGYSTFDKGAAVYVNDVAVDAAYVAANPSTSFRTTNLRGFRLSAEQDFTPLIVGAVADGVADDRAAFVTAEAHTAAATPILIPPGSYRIGSNLTINRRLVFTGGVLVIPDGVTVTLNGGISTAPSQQIFSCSGTGKVVFDWTKTSGGFLEWWGAKADASAYCDTQWAAAMTALHRVYGLPGDYLFQHTPKIPGPHMGFIGSGHKYTSTTAQATRLLLASATEDNLQVGPDAFPGSINAMPQGIEAKDFCVGRNVAPTIASGCAGVRVKYTLGAIVKRVKSQESMKAWVFYGTVASKIIDVEAARAVAGTGPGTDYWRGLHADGSAAIGAAGGNASLYIIRPNYSCTLPALQTGDSTGILIDVAFTDLFIDEPEGVSCHDDIAIVGDGVTTLDGTNCDLRINNSTADAFYRYGISISNLAASGIVEINHPYLGPNSAAAASLNITNCLGTITILAGEALHHSAPNVKPVNISSSEGVIITALGILEAGNGNAAVTLADVKNCRIAPVISNKVNTGAVAIAMSGACSANRIEATVKGKANAFTKGIDVAGIPVTFTAALVGATSATLTSNWAKASGAWTVLFSDGSTRAVTFTNGAATATWTGAVTATANATYLDDQRNEYSLTGIDSSCLTVAAQKLVRQAVNVTAVGATGSNYVSGVTG